MIKINNDSYLCTSDPDPTVVCRRACISDVFVVLGIGFLNFQSFGVLLLIVDEVLLCVGLCAVTKMKNGEVFCIQ